VRSDARFSVLPQDKAATAFLFELIARLQAAASVPMIDVRAYARWLTAAIDQSPDPALDGIVPN
jgi:hypothetical protein